ncbi:MAG: hypothetical protein ACE5DK_13125 [Paracoccaceae bacterium]
MNFRLEPFAITKKNSPIAARKREYTRYEFMATRFNPNDLSLFGSAKKINPAAKRKINRGLGRSSIRLNHGPARHPLRPANVPRVTM